MHERRARGNAPGQIGSENNGRSPGTKRGVDKLVDAFDKVGAVAVRPLTDRRDNPSWWAYIAAGVLLLVVASAALTTLGGQLQLMHLPGVEGLGVQGYSFSHLTDAISTWQASTNNVESLNLATPRQVALAWLILDACIFIADYALAGGVVLARALRPNGREELRPILEATASLLVVVAACDVLENVLSYVAVRWLWDDPPGALAVIVAVATWGKMIAGALVVISLLLLARAVWKNRSATTKGTTVLLRGQIGIAVVATANSARMRDLPSEFSRPRSHTIVVRDDFSEIVAELLCGREVDGVERPEFQGQQRAGCSQNTIADPDEVDPREDRAPSLDGMWSDRQQSSGHFRPCEGTGYEWPSPADVPTQSLRLRFSHRELH